MKRLEQYVAIGDTQVDRVFEQTVDKLLARETARLIDLKTRLEGQLVEFEQRYRIKSADFYPQSERGELGDATDFIEWSATCEMIANLDKRLALLQGDRRQ